MPLSTQNVKRCHTVNAWTVYEGKTLLIRHKKLGFWLAPGGHVEENELPHIAAQREFQEETGVIVKAISAFPFPVSGQKSEYLPLPLYCNLHEINKPRGDSFCEQHYSWGFFVRVVDLSSFNDDDDGVEDIGWFSSQDIANIETTEDIRLEAAYVFEHFPD